MIRHCFVWKGDCSGKRRHRNGPPCRRGGLFVERSRATAKTRTERFPAFTLIELLVVVAIITLLLSLLLPHMKLAREQARAAVCSSNLRQLGVGIYTYWTEWNGRVPYVWSPMTNSNGCGDGRAAGFGRDCWTDEELNPFDRARWPLSLPNTLMPMYLSEEPKLFVCPSATRWWPRQTGAPRYTYREAAANQPNGMRSPNDRYSIESFAFMDGRELRNFKMNLTGDPIRDAQEIGFSRATYVRDLVVREGELAYGPHRGGIICLDRNLQVQQRNQKITNEDLVLNSTDGGVRF